MLWERKYAVPLRTSRYLDLLLAVLDHYHVYRQKATFITDSKKIQLFGGLPEISLKLPVYIS